jgi:hypothetical protein
LAFVDVTGKPSGRFSSNQDANCPSFRVHRTFGGGEDRTYTGVNHFARKFVTVRELPLKNAAMTRVISDSQLSVSINGLAIRKLGHFRGGGQMVMNEDVVRDAAYRKWQEAGEPAGDGVQFWLEAEQECGCSGPECTEEAFDEASEESFPASDPPARSSPSSGMGKSQHRRKK